MKTLAARTGLAVGLALAVVTAGGTGCAHHSSEPTETPRTGADMQKMGAEMQKSAVMSQADYVRVDTLGRQTHQTHAMSGDDLDWVLSLLSKSGNAIARARALTTLSEIRPMSAAQKAKISPAITPYLSSADRLDQIGAQRVQKAMDAGS